ncbi:MAG: phosphate acyltransferase PlsX [Anaerolineae bacterium]|jgi:glycerol-3-phosphate acyltransferase PlsX|nr:phosphate acyltransferase PlsX [Chloroflexota bacterium]
MRIALDAMGSDGAPTIDVQGGVQAARDTGHEVVLVGDQTRLAEILARENLQGATVSIEHASQVVEMGEHPAQAVRAKKDASIVVAMGLLRDGKVDAVVSAGNSGGVLAASLASAGRIGRIPGVHRPAISTILPTLQGHLFMLDIGANTDCKPEWLVQFAHMGAAYAEHVLGISQPRIALLSNGEEKGKGSTLVQETAALLESAPCGLNLVGNVEGKDLFRGLADVVVSDGFSGNIAIKTAEGTASMLLRVLRDEIKARPLAMAGALLAKPAFGAVRKRLDFREYGGGALLGVDGVVVIAHGRSDALAIRNAIRVAISACERNIVQSIRDRLQKVTALPDSSPA